MDNSFQSPNTSDRKKSILKNRDPETEQLLPNTSPNSPAKKMKPTPANYIGISMNDIHEQQKKPIPKWSMSPKSNRKTPKAPLADLLADFDGQESNTNSKENLINKAYLDQQNANIVLRCSRKACKLNSPAHNTTVINDPLIAPYRIPLCICGAPMTRIPAQTSDTLQPTVLIPCSDIDFNNTLSSSIFTDNLQLANDRPSVSARINSARSYNNLARGKGGSNNLCSSDNLNEDSSHFAEQTATEETKLIQRAAVSRVYDKNK